MTKSALTMRSPYDVIYEYLDKNIDENGTVYDGDLANSLYDKLVEERDEEYPEQIALEIIRDFNITLDFDYDTLEELAEDLACIVEAY